MISLTESFCNNIIDLSTKYGGEIVNKISDKSFEKPDKLAPFIKTKIKGYEF